MNKIIMTAAAAAMALSLHAEFKNNPDENTLWSESGPNAAYSQKEAYKAWRFDPRLKEGADKEHFGVVGGGSCFCRYVKVSSDYPWFVYNILNVDEGKGYRMLSFSFNGVDRGFGPVGRTLPGTYVLKISPKNAKPQNCALRMDFHGAAINFGYLGMQKVPAVAPEFAGTEIKKGDELALTVTLQEPADEIKLIFYRGYGMRQIKLNGKMSYELTGNEAKKVWTLKVPYDNFTGFKASEKKTARSILAELQITRGEKIEKVYTPVTPSFQN